MRCSLSCCQKHYVLKPRQHRMWPKLVRKQCVVNLSPSLTRIELTRDTRARTKTRPPKNQSGRILSWLQPYRGELDDLPATTNKRSLGFAQIHPQGCRLISWLGTRAQPRLRCSHPDKYFLHRRRSGWCTGLSRLLQQLVDQVCGSLSKQRSCQRHPSFHASSHYCACCYGYAGSTGWRTISGARIRAQHSGLIRWTKPGIRLPCPGEQAKVGCRRWPGGACVRVVSARAWRVAQEILG